MAKSTKAHSTDENWQSRLHNALLLLYNYDQGIQSVQVVLLRLIHSEMHLVLLR
jgi:hypothetical protein